VRAPFLLRLEKVTGHQRGRTREDGAKRSSGAIARRKTGVFDALWRHLLPEGEGAEDALITRPEADVRVRVLPPGAYDFAVRLGAGATLAEAAEVLGDPQAFGTHLVGLVEAGAFRSILPGDVS